MHLQRRATSAFKLIPTILHMPTLQTNNFLFLRLLFLFRFSTFSYIAKLMYERNITYMIYYIIICPVMCQASVTRVTGHYFSN